MSDTDSFTADPHELAARVLLSQERLRDSYRGSMSGSTPTRVYLVWSACIALTAGWGKTADRTFAKSIEEQAGLGKGKASPILRDLHDRGVIVWEKDPGQRTIGRLALPDLPERTPSAEEVIARTQARRSERRTPSVEDVIGIFGEAPSAAQTDRDPRRG
jgi:hypothetical protein